MLQWEEELARQAAEAVAAVAPTTAAESGSSSDTATPSTLPNGKGCCGRGTCGSRSNGGQAPQASGSNPCSAVPDGVDGSDINGVEECADSVKKVRIGGRTAKPNLLDF